MTAPRRRWSFSLRTLLAIVALAAILIAIAAVRPRYAMLVVGMAPGIMMWLAPFLPWMFRKSRNG